MKCQYCGSNLQIDDELCPYCGKANKIAKKHREDMKKYERDYDNTKEQVISKSKSVNGKAIKVAAVALTIAVIAILIPIAATTEDIKRSHTKKAMNRAFDEYLPQLEEMMCEDDYLAIDELARTHNFGKVKNYENEYFDVIAATTSYVELLENILVVYGDNGFKTEKYAAFIGDNIVGLHKRVGEYAEIPQGWEEYAKHIEADAKLLVKTYLGISEEEYDELLEMADYKRDEIIWEAIDEIQKEKEK